MTGSCKATGGIELGGQEVSENRSLAKGGHLSRLGLESGRTCQRCITDPRKYKKLPPKYHS